MSPYRDKRYIAEHRGGPLTKEQHRQLVLWSCACVEHVFTLLAGEANERLQNALRVARAWADGNATVGDARKAAEDMLALARELTDPNAIAIVRGAGHAADAAHMADHALAGAIYALKAVKQAGLSVEAERKWQNDQLSFEIVELVLISREKKEKAMGLV